jgi:trk system potassium uptake protein TrkH
MWNQLSAEEVGFFLFHNSKFRMYDESMKKQRLGVSTTHIILLSFLIAILIGALLLSIPISSADGKATPFLDFAFPVVGGICLITCTVVTLMYYLRRGKLYILGGAFMALGAFMLLVEFLMILKEIR